VALPADVPAHAITHVCTATMTGAAESPPVASTGTRLAIVTIGSTALTIQGQAVLGGRVDTTTSANIPAAVRLPLSAPLAW
jgi:hypothetical protein